MLTNNPEEMAPMNGQPQVFPVPKPVLPVPEVAVSADPVPTGLVATQTQTGFANEIKPPADQRTPGIVSVQRCIAALPGRAPDSTWSVLIGLSARVLEARSYERCDQVRQVMERLRPLGRFALTMHALEGGSIELHTGDLRVNIETVYGVVDVAEDVSLPPVDVLDGLPVETTCTLTLFLTRPLNDSKMESLVAEVNAAGALLVRLVPLDGVRDRNHDSLGDAIDNPNDLKEEHHVNL